MCALTLDGGLFNKVYGLGFSVVYHFLCIGGYFVFYKQWDVSLL